jgi:hypothetical protein
MVGIVKECDALLRKYTRKRSISSGLDQRKGMVSGRLRLMSNPKKVRTGTSLVPHGTSCPCAQTLGKTSNLD